MTQYYLYVENNEIISSGYQPMGESFISIEVPKELHDDYVEHRNKYKYDNGNIVINPNYEQEEIEKRRAEFLKDFFNTSLGYIRRKVSMKTGETKDFLTDLLPVISMAVSQCQQVNIITYREPDFTQEIVDWESLQEYKIATPQFIQECFNQVSTDFTGV